MEEPRLRGPHFLIGEEGDSPLPSACVPRADWASLPPPQPALGQSGGRGEPPITRLSARRPAVELGIDHWWFNEPDELR
jgi:hypothetical protein